MSTTNNKFIIYQVLVRLAGNSNSSCITYGSMEQNGCGKFNNLSPAFLKSIKDFGTTHIWLTGVLEHATCQDYSNHGIMADNPLVIKGIAGSPYAIKDYYDVDPDLAQDVDNRMQEFEALIARCHQAGVKPLIDFVPNHLARNYRSDCNKPHHKDFGARDDPSREFSPFNNFYYLPGKSLSLPREVYDLPYVKDSGITHYQEFPAKATGNDRFSELLGFNDWYETIKLNYGVDYQNHGKKNFDPLPQTWIMMLDILLYWSEKQVSGFRCDMAEMVPVEFWQWVIPQVKEKYPDIIFIAEIYNPQAYHDFIFTGKFDYLYDKMGLYDTLRAVIEQRQAAASISKTWQVLEGIGAHMLRFIENHDEQRIASKHFAGNPMAGVVATTLSATIHQGPLMIYFGQETGEPASGVAGYSGDDGRTTIFDYYSVPTFQQWYNKGACDGAMLSPQQGKLRNFYSRLLHLCQHPVFTSGHFYDIMWANNPDSGFNDQHCYAFLRWDQDNTYLIIGNFHPDDSIKLRVTIPQHFHEISKRNPLNEGIAHNMLESLHPEKQQVNIANQELQVLIEPFGAMVLSLR